VARVPNAPRGLAKRPEHTAIPIEMVAASEQVLRCFGARAISLLTAARQTEDGRWLPPRLSANDCYVALEEACRKMARVALCRYRQLPPAERGEFATALPILFPDPVAYLARAVKSVIADAQRSIRHTPASISLEQPITYEQEGNILTLGDTLRETRTWKLPEQCLVEKEEALHFRAALKRGLATIPLHYREALIRDMARERERQRGIPVRPESDRERQTVCRARAALSEIIKRECGEDNPYVHLLVHSRSRRVRHKVQPTLDWTTEREENLFRRLMQTRWTERAAASPDDSVEEAVVNEVTTVKAFAPPSPEFRQTMRVLDLYTVDYPTPRTPQAQELYARARAARQAGQLEEAARLFRACYEAEPSFIPALNNVGNLLSQMGKLRDALKVFLSIVERPTRDEHTFIAATNAADIYLTWFDAGRNKERNIEQAIHYAQLAMERPTPMRACNLLLAYVKDRYYEEARKVMERVLQADAPECRGEKFLQTLFQIRDPDLIAWWNWLDTELGKE